uniref:Uncharacterized protein n=1 Tax=Vannella robusta TaxID=1487602 RepID=A0A7S4MFE0_9EUKA|mmetsp:Transcript_20530/g.25982  ORF Transcript_20530/g.25982 Transcript_20530/m.25982 type:complete len:286 (+) Transcript_20530:62-919(+)
MQRPTFTVVLTSASFLNRRLYSVTDRTTNLCVECTVCQCESHVVPEKSSLALECGHMIQCTECRDYNLEKIMRCEKCCKDIIGYFQEGCSPDCPRNTSTVKASALCAVCGSHLRKEAKCCRGSDNLKQCKKQLRACMTVLVQRPTLIDNPTAKDRPCSHYTLCQFCKSSVTKGHRSSTACKRCRTSKKRAASLKVDRVEPPVSPRRKKRCTLGALAALAGQMVDEDSDDDLAMDISSDSTPQNSSPHNSPPDTLRFGPKCGAPIWALVNPSSETKPSAKFFPQKR